MDRITSMELMKQQNVKTVLRQIHLNPSIQHKRLVELSGLAPQTVRNLVHTLVNKGLVNECIVDVKGRSRPPTALNIRYADYCMLTIDVSMHELYVAVNNLLGDVQVLEQTPFLEHMEVLPTLNKMVAHVLQQYKGSRPLVAAVASLTAVVNENTGVVIQAERFGWYNLDLCSELAYLGVPVFVRNDVNHIAYWQKLQNRQVCSSFMVVKLDDGIGSSFVLDGRVLRSVNSVAGELGHVTVHRPPHPVERCICGKHNCLTLFAAKSNLELRYGDSYAHLRQAAMRQERKAIDLLESVCDTLAPILANVIGLMDLDHVVLCGCLVDDFKTILYPRLERRIRQNLSYWVSFQTLKLATDMNPAKMSADFFIDYYFENDTNFVWY